MMQSLTETHPSWQIESIGMPPPPLPPAPELLDEPPPPAPPIPELDCPELLPDQASPPSPPAPPEFDAVPPAEQPTPTDMETMIVKPKVCRYMIFSRVAHTSVAWKHLAWQAHAFGSIDCALSAASFHEARTVITHGFTAAAHTRVEGLPMETLKTLTYEVTGRIARITLNRPERGNGITPDLPIELARCVERADLDPRVHVIALAGNGKGFCGGYDLVQNAEELHDARHARKGDPSFPEGSPIDPMVVSRNHNPDATWDPVVDYQFMSRNVRGFMSLFHANKPVVCKVHGFCVAGGTDMALCSDLLVIAEDAKIGYPPARVWGCPTTAVWALRIGPEKAKRLLFTGDSLSGREAVEWGLAIECAPREHLDERFETLLERIARNPINQLVMMKLLVNQTMNAAGLQSLQVLGTFFDGITRHTPEGYAFQKRAAEVGFKEAVRERDEPFGDFGSSTFKG